MHPCLAITKDSKMMYAISEEGSGSSKISAYKLDEKNTRN
jgi:hypothetical protein